jgi:hypothetical protein
MSKSTLFGLFVESVALVKVGVIAITWNYGWGGNKTQGDIFNASDITAAALSW